MAFAWHEGRIVGKARALSDFVCNVYVIDVWTHSELRRQGIGSAMMEFIEQKSDGCHIGLFTDSASNFYRNVGFKEGDQTFEKVVGTWLRR